MYKLCFYVPESHLESVKQAVFEAGAGRVGDYDYCAWQVKGTGQFKPLAGARPFIGATGTIERLDEFKVELVCAEQFITAVVAALRLAHPYEEPAYDVVKLLTLPELP